MNVLVTCPPMIGMRDQFIPIFTERGINISIPEFTQVMEESELIRIIPNYDGWIIGDDPASQRVFEAGASGELKAVVKWGVGTDNVDFDACKRLGIKVANTPYMFGSEVAELAVGYLIALARETHIIDRGVRSGNWTKVRGLSLVGKKVGVVGYGDVGMCTVDRLRAFGVQITVFDPALGNRNVEGVRVAQWPANLEDLDFIVFTCSLNDDNIHMFDEKVINSCKQGVRIVNVARGQLIHEQALINCLKSGQVYSAALDVFETEPLPADSFLCNHDRSILGSHNASNTAEAVARANHKAIKILMEFLFENIE